MIGVTEPINKSETIGTDITDIERHIPVGTDEHSLLNKGNEIQGSGKAVSPWFLLLDSQSTVNIIMKKELLKDIRDKRWRFANFHCNEGTRITRKDTTLTGFGTVWYNDRCIVNILSLSKAKNNYHVMYDSAEVNKFITVMTDKEVLSN